jgi:L-fuconolactonase
MPHRIIDTHIHNWNFDKATYAWLEGNTSILNRTYNVEEIETERIAVGVTDGVLVQSANNTADTDWMLETASAKEWIKGVVGWLPLMDPDATYEMLTTKYLANPYFKGIRHLIHDEPNADWLLQPQVLESLQVLADHNLPYDIVGVLPQHIETVLKVAEKIPSLKMVFDHLNQPPIKTKEQFGVWGTLMQEAAQHKNFHAKISGLGTATADIDNWNEENLLPYIQFIMENFGTDRCFCGGDWPVSLLAANYTKTWTTYINIIQQLVDTATQEKIFYTNAKQFYNL